VARYTFGSVTGYSSMGGGRNAGRPRTTAYVYDSAYCYRPVAVFWGGTDPERALGPAREMAERLNNEELRWEQSL